MSTSVIETKPQETKRFRDFVAHFTARHGIELSIELCEKIAEHLPAFVAEGTEVVDNQNLTTE